MLTMRGLRAGLAVLALLVLPNVATAGRIEAVWQVTLQTQEDLPTNTYEPLSVPRQFQVRTVFGDYVGATSRGPLDAHTRFGNPDDTHFDRPLDSYTIPNPFPSDAQRTLVVRATTYDYPPFNEFPAVFREEFSIGIWEQALGDTRGWQYFSFLTISLEHPGRTGDGSSAYFFTTEMLWDFLTGFKNGAADYNTAYVVGSSLFDMNTRRDVAGKRWEGSLELVSLRRISDTDVPEPATFALLGIGLVSAGLAGRRSRRKAEAN